MGAGATIDVKIDLLDDEGRGVGRAGGRELHVAGALPGETVSAVVEHDSPHGDRSWARLAGPPGVPSPDRVPPVCPAYGSCGGCALQHLAYLAQLTVKRERVERALAGLPDGAFADPAARRVDDVVPSPTELGTRNKAKYVIAARAGGPGLVLGSFAPGTHTVVDMVGCRVPEPPIDDVARAFRKLAEGAGLTAYDERTRTGELRHLVVRVAADGEVLVVVVARSRAAEVALREVARALAAERPEVAGVVLHVNALAGGAIFHEAGSAGGDDASGEDLVLDGAGELTDEVGSVHLVLSARAFFQVHRAQAARLYDEVARAISGRGSLAGRRIADLYSGIGGIALSLARQGARVVGVESHAGAVADARRSADANGLQSLAQFEIADAATGLTSAARALCGLDAIVVNPPRKGLHEAARAALVAAAAPHLVYVSCGPESLARDLTALVAAGYLIDHVRPYDLMPGTPHVETVVSLSRHARTTQ